MGGTETDRRIRLCVPQGRVDPAGLSLEGLSGPLADADVDVTGVDAIEVAFDEIASTPVTSISASASGPDNPSSESPAGSIRP